MPQSADLKATPFFDFTHPSIQQKLAQLDAPNNVDKVIQAYYLVRDSIEYNPYTFTEGKNALRASYAASHKSAYCIPKSALMVALCRALGVPARIGLADVKNHLSSPKLLTWLKTDLFVMHGYAELFLHGKWVKCTPVFNQSLCDKAGIPALEFDGHNDSIFHPFTGQGARHMEYITDHGTFSDMPDELIFKSAHQTYPHLMTRNSQWHDDKAQKSTVESLEAELN